MCNPRAPPLQLGGHHSNEGGSRVLLLLLLEIGIEGHRKGSISLYTCILLGIGIEGRLKGSISLLPVVTDAGRQKRRSGYNLRVLPKETQKENGPTCDFFPSPPAVGG